MSSIHRSTGTNVNTAQAVSDHSNIQERINTLRAAHLVRCREITEMQIRARQNGEAFAGVEDAMKKENEAYAAEMQRLQAQLFNGHRL